MPSDPTSDQLSAIKNDLFQGRKIAAIKKHRESTGSTLSNAKSFVDQLEDELRASNPELFVARPAGAGCGFIIVVIIVLAASAMVGVWLLKK